jgi:Integrase core domain
VDRPGHRVPAASAFSTRANAYFNNGGVTVLRVLTDNGAPYRSKQFAQTLGPITHKRTRPYRPQTNGKVERFNRTLGEEWAYARAYLSEAERVAAYDTFIHTYNHHRGHTALAGKSPADRVPNLRGQYTPPLPARGVGDGGGIVRHGNSLGHSGFGNSGAVVAPSVSTSVPASASSARTTQPSPRKSPTPTSPRTVTLARSMPVRTQLASDRRGLQPDEPRPVNRRIDGGSDSWLSRRLVHGWDPGRRLWKIISDKWLGSAR